MKVKKLLALVIAIAFVVTMVAGCGSSSNNASSSSSSEATGASSAVSSTAAPSLEPYEINWYMVGDTPRDKAMVEEAADKYLKDKINATLKLNFLDWGSYNDKVNAMLASGEYMDIFFTCSWFADVRANALNGGILPIDDLMTQYAPKTKALLGEDFLKAASIKGKLYAVPTNKEKAQGTGVLLKKDLMDKYKVDPTKITKLEDLEPYFEQIKKNEPGIYAVEACAGASGPVRLGADVDSPAPGCAIAADGKTIIPTFDHPSYDKYYKLTRKYYEAGYIRKDSLSLTDTTPDKQAGKYFCIFEQLKPGKDVEVSASLKYEVKQINFGKPMITNGDISGSMQGIARSSKDPARCMMFLELFNTDPYLNNLINNGIEGTHYSKINDDTIDLDGGSEGKDSGYRPAAAWMLGNVFLTYLMKGDAPDKWEQYKKWNEEATYAPSVGFVFDQEPVKTEVAAMGNVDAEFAGIKSGALDPSVEIPKFRAKMEAAGLNKVVAECQKQFDEFLATKK